ncbi:MAG: restriction endonuclease subunit S [Verrucomicrobia bacterium]|nr:restriction endonuclease subunit S [Verrucomicrobiota bacterium]
MACYHAWKSKTAKPAYIDEPGFCKSVRLEEIFVTNPGTTVWRSTDADVLDQRYLYCFMRSVAFMDQLWSQVGNNSTFDYVSLTQQRGLRIAFPPLTEQRAIASVLGALDDKMELNRRMSETLGALAQSLFKSGFVDATQSALPKGWREGRLDEMLVLQRGFDLPSTQRTQGPYPVLCASGPNGTHGEFMVRGPGVTTGRSGSLGQVYFVHEDFWPHNTSLWVKEFKHSTPLFAFHLLRTLDFETFNSGSAVPTLNRNHVHSLPVNIPPMELIQKFEATVSPMYQRLKSNDDESRTLAALRDALLPKLLSGELRVPAAAKLVEAIA